MLNRDLILDAVDIPQGEVDVPEWGGAVVVRGFNARERSQVTEMYSRAQKDGRVQPESIAAKIAVMCVLNGKGPMFTESDIDALESKSPAALDRIMVKVQELSGLASDDAEDLEKKLIEHPERRFLFRLALALGCSVSELQIRLSSRELSEWFAFHSLEPWGSDVDSWRSGMIAAVIGNVNRDSKKQPKPFTPQDFMPGNKPKQQTLAEQIAIMKSFNGD